MNYTSDLESQQPVTFEFAVVLIAYVMLWFYVQLLHAILVQ